MWYDDTLTVSRGLRFVIQDWFFLTRLGTEPGISDTEAKAPPLSYRSRSYFRQALLVPALELLAPYSGHRLAPCECHFCLPWPTPPITTTYCTACHRPHGKPEEDCSWVSRNPRSAEELHAPAHRLGHRLHLSRPKGLCYCITRSKLQVVSLCAG